MKNTKKSKENMPVKVCPKCGAVNSVMKDSCENCAAKLPEPTKNKFAVIESEIIRLQNCISENSGNQNNLNKEEADLVKLAVITHRRLTMVVPTPNSRRNKRRLKSLQRRLERMKAKDEKTSAQSN